ncbi:MAG TPA: N-acetylmuramoyl-L-alanine amidase [Kofleriaceae bacterium]|jgi:hypothetical protein
MGSNAMLVDGTLVPVPGVTVIGSHDEEWAHLDPGDYCWRGTIPVTKVMLHKTIADDPEKLIAGKGPAGGAERDAKFWQQDPAHSGAQLVSGHDGVLACLCDVVRCAAYHATISNMDSIGIETCELVGGGVYEAALETTVAATLALVEHLGVQLQVPSRTYNGHPLKRMLAGERELVGVFGHRDNTEARGRWDPGEELFRRLRARGAEAFDFDAGEDLAKWRERQTVLVAKGHKLIVDGIPGPATTAALKAEGYRGGVYALGKI